MEDFLRQAIRLAMQNVGSVAGGPFGAVIAKDNQVVASGRNLVLSVNDPTAHAEMVAIRAACKALGTYVLEGCDLYTSCEPCPMCLGAIYWARLRQVYFAAGREDAEESGFGDASIYRQLEVEPERRSIPGRQLLAEEGREVFRRWQASGAAILY